MVLAALLSVCADGATEEGDESIDRGCIVGDGLSWIESSGAWLRGELDPGEGQRLFSQIVRQFSGLAGGPG